MGEKRRVVGDDAVADLPLPSRPAETAPDTPTGPETTAASTPGESRQTVTTPADTAQTGYNNAQSLPIAVPAATGFPGTTGDAREPGPSAATGFLGTTGDAPEPGPSAATPATGSQPGSTQSAANLTMSTTPADLGPGPNQGTVSVQQATAGVDQPQPNRQGPPPPVPTSGPGHAATGTNQHAPGTGADAQSGGLDEETGTRQHPALGRAMQVQAAVTVENATGLAPLAAPGSLQAAASVTGLVNTDVQAPASGAAGLGLDDAQATGRVIRGLTSMLAQRGGAMTMRLDPPGLGHLRVEMTIARGIVTAQFQPTTTEAQALLERSLATLRTALESQGLTVERLTVHAAPPAPSARETAHDQSQAEQHASRHHADAGDGRSRGRGDDETGHDRPNHSFTASFAAAFDSEVLPEGAEAA